MTQQKSYNFIKTRLDVSLLSDDERINVNWYVITGAPCSGKTTIIEELKKKGHKTVSETAREYIEEELSKKITIQELRKNESIFQRKLLDLRLKVEGELDPKEKIFLDRALAEFATFYRANGLDPNEIIVECSRYLYKAVFILDRLPLEKDGVRAEDSIESEFIDEWLEQDYEAIGIKTVRVPIMPISDRLEYILERVKKS